MNNKEYTSFVIRLTLGFIYLSAGWAKLAPNDLGNIIGPVDISHATDSVAILTSFKIIAYFQMITGALILSQKYSLIGLLVLFPLSLGTFIFTLISGFGGTPFFNLIFLVMNCYALIIEKEIVKSIVKRNYSSIYDSVVSKKFPNKTLPKFSFILLLSLIICSFFLNGILLNIIGTVCILLFCVNMLQFKKFLFIDNIILVLYFLICFITTNGILLNSYIDKFFYSVFYLILLGLLIFTVRVSIVSFRKKAELI